MARTAVVGRLTEADCRLEDLLEVLAERTDPADYPYAEAVVDEVLVYDSAQLRAALAGVAAELVRALADGPGIVVFRGAVDRAVVGRATTAFQELIAEQRAAGTVDHFAPPRANDRVWNALEKLAGTDVGYAAAAAAEGYPFPTNLDRDPPVDGLAPPSQADLVRRALAERWDPARFDAELSAQSERRHST